VSLHRVGDEDETGDVAGRERGRREMKIKSAEARHYERPR
jgi:hypothetical protein